MMNLASRWLLAVVTLVAFAWAPAPAAAQAYVDTEALDYFFDALRSAPDAVSAQVASAEIWYIWTHPDDPELANQMQKALQVRTQGDYPRTIEILDAIIERWPNYAEGWNQRATIYYLMRNYEASLADVDATLALEPRHFGALSGAAIIYLAMGNRAAALQKMMLAMRYHPFLAERRLFPELLVPQVEI